MFVSLARSDPCIFSFFFFFFGRGWEVVVMVVVVVVAGCLGVSFMLPFNFVDIYLI